MKALAPARPQVWELHSAVNSQCQTRTPSARREPKTLLLVDDDPSVRQMVGRVLGEEGYEVLKAINGLEALGMVKAHEVDLVLLDLNMPTESGWDTFAKLTSHNPLLAVIIITARPNQLFTSLAAGVGALLEKPLDFPMLLQTVDALLAESPETRLSRLTGQPVGLHYRSSVETEA